MRHLVITSRAAAAALVAVLTVLTVLTPGLFGVASPSGAAQASTPGDHRDPVAPHRGAHRPAHRAAHRPAQVSRSSTREADADPLGVSIDALTPSVIPARGDIQVSGEVTNNDVSTWSTIKLYPVVSAEPLTTAAEIDTAAASDPDEVIGDRIVDDTHNATIDTLAPGQTAPFRFFVPRGLLGATTPGVYQFGVQALGQGPDGRVDGADGRARTFLPLVSQQTTSRLPVSVVLPLRRPIGYADDGSVTDVTGWLQTLSDGGRLRSLVDLGGSAESQPVSWLVDPALVDAVRRLAAGNPARSLAPNLVPGQGTDPDASSSPSSGTGSQSPSDAPTASATGPTGDAGTTGSSTTATDGEPAPLSQRQLARVDAGTREVALAAQDWLTRLTNAVQPGDELLMLPYGDTDVSGAAAHAPRVYQVARVRSGTATVIDGLAGVQMAPAVSSPSGYLDPTALSLVDTGTTTLVTDQMFRDPPATLATTSGRHLVVTSSDAVAGGPGPDDPTATTAMRQRLLAEAAVRALGGDPQPLVAVLPYDWNPRDATGFFSGLDTPWVQLATVADATAGASPTAIDPGALRYPQSQDSDELDAANFEAASRLITTGAALQSMLTLNNLIAVTVGDEALVATSYAARTHPDANRVATDRARSWIDERMRRVTVSAPTAVNLLSSSGRFNTTIRNGLDQPVTVALDARTDSGLRVTGPRRIIVPAGGIASVPLGARTDKTGVHQVTLRLTDQRGVALGGTTELSVRSSQVSGIIWLFLAIGAVLLFGTIAVRLFRRVRDARRGVPHDVPPGSAPEPSGDATRNGPGPTHHDERAGAGSR